MTDRPQTTRPIAALDVPADADTMGQRMIVDTHTHVWQSPEQWGPQIGALLRQRYGAPAQGLDASAQAYLEAVKTVDVAFLLGFTSDRLGADLPESLMASILSEAPDRVMAFAGIDPMRDGYLDAFDAAAARRMRGVVISPAEQGFQPQHSRAMRIYEKCQALKLPLIVHQGEDFVADSMLEYAQPYLLDTVARDFPELRILITHCGHPWTDQALTLIGKHKHVYAELSGLSARPRQLYSVLLAAHQLEVTDRLLFGSDFPRQSPQKAIAAIYSLNQLTQGTTMGAVPREKLRAIVERDALAALGIKRASPSDGAAIRLGESSAGQQASVA